MTLPKAQGLVLFCFERLSGIFCFRAKGYSDGYRKIGAQPGMPGGKRNSNNVRREVKYMRLSNGERSLVEENMGLVGKVIKDKVRDVQSIGIFTYDDLFQIGCIGLCKAAATRVPGKGRFSTYAYMLIRNEIFSALEYATLRKNREIAAEPEERPTSQSLDELYDGSEEALNQALAAALMRASGITAKGIGAIRLLAEGYTHREIGERMGGVSANNVSAWVARARRFLRADPAVAAFADML
jgi:RNA polymerase sigma factor (sigma-70 family)